VDVFEAVADPVRRDLLRRLVDGPARVVDLAAAHDISRPAISRHLRVLTEAGLTTADDRGRERHYRLLPAGLEPVRRLLDELAADDGAASTDARAAQGSAPRPRFTEGHLDGLDLEVRRTGADRRHGRPTARRTTAAATTTTEETA
jgi:DNA-binding transcriptional ArsR family regulator